MDLKDSERLGGVTGVLEKIEEDGFNKSYADFDRRFWPKRTNSEHGKLAEEIKMANTLGAREELKTKYGIQYTCLLNLPYYYDAIQMSTIVDPLHNLYFSTASMF